MTTRARDALKHVVDTTMPMHGGGRRNRHHSCTSLMGTQSLVGHMRTDAQCGASSGRLSRFRDAWSSSHEGSSGMMSRRNCRSVACRHKKCLNSRAGLDSCTSGTPAVRVRVTVGRS